MNSNGIQNKLIFLPIEINIPQTEFFFDQALQPTWNGKWMTHFFNNDDYCREDIRHIIDQLPFEKITLGKYNTQTADADVHIDVSLPIIQDQDQFDHIKQHEPAGYRLLLDGRTDALEVFDGNKWQTAHLPACPFLYVLNSSSSEHRVLNDNGRKTMYFRGFLNSIGHQELIKKNLKKFSEYAIYGR